jgi:hypothetical protein
MTQVHVDDQVRLTQDIPELGLHRGEVGLVCSTWFAPSTAFEVEFEHERCCHALRALLMSSQLQKQEETVHA